MLPYYSPLRNRNSYILYVIIPFIFPKIRSVARPISVEDVVPSPHLYRFAVENGPVTGLWWRILLTIGLVLLGGLFAGLTLGLMSLDPINLEVLKNSGTPRERKYATRILPIRKHGHLLLVTLLLSNTIVNETLPLVMDSFLSGGWQAILISVSLVVLCGEILPQAVCSRYGLAIGANLIWLVKFLIVVLFVVAWPISLLLNCLLGEKDGVIYRRAGLKELVALHEQTQQGELTADEGTILKSVLDFREKNVLSAYTPIDHVFMLEENELLSRECLERILECGHSRIPIFQKERKNIVGILLTKKLLMVHLNEQSSLCDIAHADTIKVDHDTSLFDMLNVFQGGKSHLAVVVSSVNNETLGIITLEDVIEELIGEEIVDESDIYIDVVKRIRVARGTSFFTDVPASPHLDDLSEGQRDSHHDEIPLPNDFPVEQNEP